MGKRAYKDADGSEFFVLPSGEAVRADGTRVPELDGPPAGACQECGNSPGFTVEDITIEHPLADEIHAAVHAGCIDRSEVARVLASELYEAGCKATYLGVRVDKLRYEAKRLVLEIVASRLGIYAEYRAALSNTETTTPNPKA